MAAAGGGGPVGATPKSRNLMRFLAVDPEIYPLMGVLLTIFTAVGYMAGRKVTSVKSESGVRLANHRPYPWHPLDEDEQRDGSSSKNGTQEKGREGGGSNRDFKYRFYKYGDPNDEVLEAPSAINKHKINVKMPKDKIPDGMKDEDAREAYAIVESEIGESESTICATFQFIDYGKNNIKVSIRAEQKGRFSDDCYEYHIHENPIKNGVCKTGGEHYNPTRVSYKNQGFKCEDLPWEEKSPDVCEIGDLSGFHGNLCYDPDTHNIPKRSYIHPFLTVKEIVGRSVMIHLPHGELACGTIYSGAP
ncbi:hypothetical protein G9A89_009797 [Geosiphon pyriformis]|nr:hypothetical protein G9A89_009797 [Geosiphon pyriformis]